MYEISNEILNKIQEEFEETLDKYGYPYDSDAVGYSILDTWAERKAALLDLFSKHPNWDPERLMIKFDADFSREINTAVTQYFMNWLTNHTNADFVYVSGYSLGYLLRNYLTKSTYIENDANGEWIIKSLNEFNENFRFRTGMKTTKIVRKICKEYGWDSIMQTEIDFHGNERTYNAFEREYAKYCDAICPLKVKRHTCISLNPLDFLLMSNGNSWRSCHRIEEYGDAGEYSSGTISYMLDTTSFVFYTVDAEFNGVEIELEKKLQRQIFGYCDYQLLQSRLYPQHNDGSTSLYADIRAIVQKVVADCLEKPNLWVKMSERNLRRGSGATCYADWAYSSSNSVMTKIKDHPERVLKEMVLGAQPRCIECGGLHSEAHTITCCSNNRYKTCEDCGREIDEEDGYWIGGYFYCDECVTICERCGEAVHNDDSCYIESEDKYVCDVCRDEYYTYCTHCCSYVLNDEVQWVDQYYQYVCEDCLDTDFFKCEECGEYFHDSPLYRATDPNTGEVLDLCKDCAEELEDMEDEE